MKMIILNKLPLVLCLLLCIACFALSITLRDSILQQFCRAMAIVSGLLLLQNIAKKKLKLPENEKFTTN